MNDFLSWCMHFLVPFPGHTLCYCTLRGQFKGTASDLFVIKIFFAHTAFKCGSINGYKTGLFRHNKRRDGYQGHIYGL